MYAENNLNLILEDKHIDSSLKEIAKKVLNDTRISFEEGVYLYENGSLGYLGVLANFIRERKHGDLTYFNRNFHIEPTNLCVYDCKFCSYSRLLKNKDDGWEMSIDEMLDQVKAYDGEAITEVHITGGVVPKQDLDFYADFF